MPTTTTEPTINTVLGQILAELRPRSWRVMAEERSRLRHGGQPDILIEEASRWPVVIEAEREDHDSAETDAIARLRRVVSESRRPIESAVALVYPPEVRRASGIDAIREALTSTDGLEYALYSRTTGFLHERLPDSGWLRGSVNDLAMLVHRAMMPAPRVERMGRILEEGIESAAAEFTERHGSHAPDSLGDDVATQLGQADDQGGQTRRMAMTVIINALIFHEALAESEFLITDANQRQRRVRALRELLPAGDYDIDALLSEWTAILEVNYWPIFATAKQIVGLLSSPTDVAVLRPLRRAALRLVQRGVTKSHDLTGVIFQRLIADRKFLATFYTRPAAAALLAALAIPADRALGGAEWGDESVHALQIGDFACGTGTLLDAAYQRISILHELHGGNPKQLHAPMMEHGLVGLDVLNIAVHLTAAMLAGAQPDTPFDGECLLTMPYGGELASIGSLELLAEHVQPSMVDAAAAVTAGGRRPEDVQDLVNRVGHGQFDLVIMNPPFTRQGGQEAERKGIGNAAFAAFETSRQTQDAMQAKLKKASGLDGLGSGNAGLASHFLDLALRKLRTGGQLAMVLPLSSMSGITWERIRQTIRERCTDIMVITISSAGSFERSFSADTGMAECLLVATKVKQRLDTHQEATFAVLNRRQHSLIEGDQIGIEISTLLAGNVGSLTNPAEHASPIRIGDDFAGNLIRASLPDSGPWQLVGISDLSLAQVASALMRGLLIYLGMPNTSPSSVPIVSVGRIGNAGPYHLDIRADLSDGSPRGPFTVIRPPQHVAPTYPMLWAHDAKLERRLIVAPDSEGQIKSWPQEQDALNAKAAEIWATATRAHYNSDARFNAQSLFVSITEHKCIGGHAWPSVILHDRSHEYAFALWCNSTLGLLLHWWSSNKTQSGRGRTTVTGIPNIPTLDTRALSDAQHAEAARQFVLLAEERFLPFDQIDEDPARARLDRAILVDVLGLPTSLLEPDGPLDLLRRKLAQEPQIHGGKRSRVVFTDSGERSVRRSDRD